MLQRSARRCPVFVFATSAIGSPRRLSRSNRETEPSHTVAERRSHTASNDARKRLSLVRLGVQKVPETRAISHCAPENAATARLGGGERGI